MVRIKDHRKPIVFFLRKLGYKVHTGSSNHEILHCLSKAGFNIPSSAFSNKTQAKRFIKQVGEQLAFDPFYKPAEYIKTAVPSGVKKHSDFYESQEWKRVRYLALKKNNGRCECCGSTGPLQVDHIKPRSLHPALELDLNNLQVLCADCNQGKSNIDDTDWRNK